MVEFASPILLCPTLHPFNLYLGHRARSQLHPIIVWAPPFKEIITLAGRRSQSISQGLLRLRCQKSQVGKRCQWPARHQTSQRSQVLCERQLPRELFLPPGSFLCSLVAVRYSFIYIFIFFFLAKWPFSCSLIASISACHSERCLPVAGRFITVLIDIVSIPNSHGVLFSPLDSCV